jgi:phosphoribosylanthranilate isomerase
MATKIKICGITSLQDAIDAIDAGANALGFVFYQKSPRYINPQDAKKIIEKLPPFVQSVGLFVDEVASKIDFIARLTKIDLAQIHFDVEESFYDKLLTKYVKVIRAKTKEDILRYKDEYVLIDAFVEEYGGVGKRLDLNWFKGVNCSKIILAGGLSSKNLKQLEGFGFYGVDVSSAVEISKGKKDKQKMIEFCKIANEIS